MILEEPTRKEIERYFKARYDFEEATKDQRGGLNDVKKTLSKVMQVKPRTLNDAYKSWKKKCSGETEEDDTAEVTLIVSAVIEKTVS
jgi:hypothetical protein